MELRCFHCRPALARRLSVLPWRIVFGQLPSDHTPMAVASAQVPAEICFQWSGQTNAATINELPASVDTCSCLPVHLTEGVRAEIEVINVQSDLQTSTRSPAHHGTYAAVGGHRRGSSSAMPDWARREHQHGIGRDSWSQAVAKCRARRRSVARFAEPGSEATRLHSALVSGDRHHTANQNIAAGHQTERAIRH